MKPELTEYESKALNTSLIKIGVEAFSKDIFLWQDERLHTIIAGSYDSQKLIGPFREGEFNYLLKDHFGKKLKFEAGYSYQIERKQSVLTTIKKFEEGDPLSSIERGQKFGEIAMRWDDSLHSTPTFIPNFKHIQYKGTDIPSRIGKLIIQRSPVSRIIGAIFWSMDEPANVYSHANRTYSPNTLQFSDLIAGIYQFILINEEGKFHKMNPIEIKGEQVLYLKARDLAFIEREEWQEMLKHNDQTNGTGYFLPTGHSKWRTEYFW